MSSGVQKLIFNYKLFLIFKNEQHEALKSLFSGVRLLSEEYFNIYEEKERQHFAKI